MPGGRGKYNPGLSDGGRARYTGPDAYANQQREYETRVVKTDTGAFLAPIWFSQTPPGGLTNWYANFDPQTADKSPPPLVPGDAHPEFGVAAWQNVSLQQFTFVDQGQTFSGFLPVVPPGWWTFNLVCRVSGTALTTSDVALVLVPASVLSTGSLAQQIRLLAGSAVFATNIGIVPLSITILLTRPTAVTFIYEASTVPTLQGTGTAASGTGIAFQSFLSGHQIG